MYVARTAEAVKYHLIANQQVREAITKLLVYARAAATHGLQQMTYIFLQHHQKNKTVAMLLCIFLGCLGCHYFYVGKAGMGVLYLLTMGLFGIGWIVDIIRIAGGSFKDVNGLPLN